MKGFLSFILILLFQLGVSQIPDWHNPNFRVKIFGVNDSLAIDSLMILNDKFTVKDQKGNIVPEDLYHINFEESKIYFSQVPTTDSIRIEYYVHPTLRRTETFPLNPGLIVPSASENSAVIAGNITHQEKPIFDHLETSGNMIRGITFGNNQGSSVQSSLDLSMNGQLSPKLGIRAMISDTNVPIEADGYTQNLEQFDRVFVELFTDRSSARAGHVDLEQNREYFGNFNRRVTGMQLKHMISSEHSTTHLEAAGSVARGEFKQFKFNGTEGNQGPYRLEGNHGEAYVIILSGSERIYKNGLLLQRGENFDYVINYNTGEITFTNRLLVRTTDRFTAEYQYTNRNYNRFALYGGGTHTSKRFTISSHIYSESDSKNNPVNQTLSVEDKQILANAGNNVNEMYTSSAVQVPFEEGKVLYRRIILNGAEVFEYSTDPDEVLYQIGFTQMGENQGNYILSSNGVNGRVFEYVTPLNGIPQGSFSPVRLLVAPNSKQVWSLATSYQLKNKGILQLDAGLSHVDQNLYSDLDDAENLGLGVKFGGSQPFKAWGIIIEPAVNYEFIQDNFSPLERIRSPEFARDFNLLQEIAAADQHFLQTNINAFVSDSLRALYGFDFLSYGNDYQGSRHRMSGLYLGDKLNFSADLNILSTEASYETTDFTTYNVSANRKLGKIQIGAGTLGESNSRRLLAGQDSLSFRWNEIYSTVIVGDTVSRFAHLRIYRRTDDSASLQGMKRYSTSTGAEFDARLINTENHGIRFLTHYRSVEYQDSIQPISFLNATIQWRKSLWQRALELGVNYEISGGTELQRAFTYVQVADGLGIYKWLDYNQDGVQQLDEFEVAEFTDQASFIRVYTNTVENLRTNRNNFNFSLRFNPSRYFGNDSYWHRFESSVLYSTTGNYLKNNQMAAWNPWRGNDHIRSETTQFYWQNKFNSPMQYRFKLIHELSLQDNTRFVFTGIETLNVSHNKITSRYKISNILSAELGNTLSWVHSDSDAFASKRFSLEGLEVVPRLYFSWEENVKMSVAYTVKSFENKTGIEHFNSGQINLDFSWNDKEKTSVLASADWVKNDFTGNQDSVVGNRMMEGLRDGSNFVWHLMLQRNINSYLELNLQYAGRKNEDFKAVHTGNVQLRLNF